MSSFMFNALHAKTRAQQDDYECFHCRALTLPCDGTEENIRMLMQCIWETQFSGTLRCQPILLLFRVHQTVITWDAKMWTRLFSFSKPCCFRAFCCRISFWDSVRIATLSLDLKSCLAHWHPEYCFTKDYYRQKKERGKKVEVVCTVY